MKKSLLKKHLKVSRHILFITLLLFSFKGFAQSWHSLGTGTNDAVFSMAVYNGELYIGGMFKTAGGIHAPNIARWNGISWDSVGSGMDTAVRALVVYNNELYAGGDFNFAGGIYVGHIAKWNGTNWSPVGAGMGGLGIINAFAVYNGKLYAGGYFSTADNLTANNIARYNGTTWDSVRSGIGGTYPIVWAMAVYNGSLIVGGAFNKAGGLPAVYIASWNDTSWNALSSSIGAAHIYNQVLALDTFQSDLYVGGSFDTIGTLAVPYLSKWNGSVWSAVGTGVNDAVLDFASDAANLYVGGFFTSEGNRIAKWNGTNWSTLGTGMNPWVTSLSFYNGELFAGGSFTIADGNPANHIARWGIGTGINNNLNNDIISISPNPNSGKFIIQLQNQLPDSKIELYNTLGEKINTTQLYTNSTELDLPGNTKGLYFFRLFSDNKFVSSGKIIVQ